MKNKNSSLELRNEQVQKSIIAWKKKCRTLPAPGTPEFLEWLKTGKRN